MIMTNSNFSVKCTDQKTFEIPRGFLGKFIVKNSHDEIFNTFEHSYKQNAHTFKQKKTPTTTLAS